MFGRPQRPAGPAAVDWNDKFFHEKLQHLVDHGSDWLFGKVYWWIPAVGGGMLASLVLFSGENVVPEAMNLLSVVAVPYPQHTVFGQRMPAEMMQQEGVEEDAEDDE
jgi:hypothetical protein